MQHIYNQSFLSPKELELCLIAMIKDSERIINLTRISNFTGPNKNLACYVIITEDLK
jgi:hypothetical protein